MYQEQIVKGFLDVGAIITDTHVVYTSGEHGSVYVNKDAIYPHVWMISRLCKEIAKRFVGYRVDTVIAPEKGGIILSQWVAHHLSEINEWPVRAVYAEKDAGGFFIRRGYDKFITNHNVLVVEDVINTGGSVKKTLDAVRSIRGGVVGIGALCNRGEKTADDFCVAKLDALTHLPFGTWSEEECPLCRMNVRINTEVGKGREFLERRAKIA